MTTDQDPTTDDDWAELIAREWADDLADPRQDIYTLADGEPIAESPAREPDARD